MALLLVALALPACETLRLGAVAARAPAAARALIVRVEPEMAFTLQASVSSLTGASEENAKRMAAPALAAELRAAMREAGFQVEERSNVPYDVLATVSGRIYPEAEPPYYARVRLSLMDALGERVDEIAFDEQQAWKISAINTQLACRRSSQGTVVGCPARLVALMLVEGMGKSSRLLTLGQRLGPASAGEQ
jgi:hypothetical protein